MINFELYKEKIRIKNINTNLPRCSELYKKAGAAVGFKLLLYIYLIYGRNEDNPIKDLRLKEREIEAANVVFNRSSKINFKSAYPKLYKLIAAASDEYRLGTDKTQKSIDLYDEKMFQFIDLLTKNKPEIIKNTHTLSGRVTYSTNIDILTTVLDNSINIILDKAALVALKKTGKYDNALRVGLSPNTKGKLTKIKD